jgi:hypothetical protein
VETKRADGVSAINVALTRAKIDARGVILVLPKGDGLKKALPLGCFPVASPCSEAIERNQAYRFFSAAC